MPLDAQTRNSQRVRHRGSKRGVQSVQEQQSSTGSNSIQALQPCCRICLDTEEQGSPLITPCNCKGTLSHVHVDCLQEWRTRMRNSGQTSKYRRCEICRAVYRLPPDLMPLGPRDLRWWHKMFIDAVEMSMETATALTSSTAWHAIIRMWRIGVLLCAGINGIRHMFLWSRILVDSMIVQWDAVTQMLINNIPPLMVLAVLFPPAQVPLGITFIGIEAAFGLYLVSGLILGACAGLIYGGFMGATMAAGFSVKSIMGAMRLGLQLGKSVVGYPLYMGAKVLFSPLKYIWGVFAIDSSPQLSRAQAASGLLANNVNQLQPLSQRSGRVVTPPNRRRIVR